jgi:hypothetical protein
METKRIDCGHCGYHFDAPKNDNIPFFVCPKCGHTTSFDSTGATVAPEPAPVPEPKKEEEEGGAKTQSIGILGGFEATPVEEESVEEVSAEETTEEKKEEPSNLWQDVKKKFM